MRYWYREKTYIYLAFPYDEVILRDVKSRRFLYNPQTKEWYRDISEGVMDVDTIIRKYNFVQGKPQPPEKKLVLEEIEEIISRDELKEMVDNLNLSITPRPYQMDCIYYMLNHPGCINGSSPGTGKTLVAITITELLEAFPCLIVCPSSVKYNWMYEWKKITGKDRKIQVLEGKSEWEEGNDVYIINYDILSKKDEEKQAIIRFPQLTSTPWGIIFADEAHMCKNRDSIRSKMLKKIVGKNNLIYLLTGTAIMNRPFELINLLELVRWFKQLFNWMDFVYRYCNAKKRIIHGKAYGWDTTCARNTLELNKIISHYCYIRKEKREVLTELPPLIENIIPLPISNSRTYEKAERDFIDYLRREDEEKMWRALNAEYLVKLNVLKELSLKGKMKKIEEWLSDWKEIKDEKLLIFGVRREPLKELSIKYNGLLIQGGITADKKYQIVQQFKNTDTQFLFANIDSVGVGVDGLQDVCSNIAYIELPDKFTSLDQANSRLERMGQKDSINVYYLLSPETIDMQISKMIERKKKITDAVNRGVVDEERIDIDEELIQYLRNKKI